MWQNTLGYTAHSVINPTIVLSLWLAVSKDNCTMATHHVQNSGKVSNIWKDFFLLNYHYWISKDRFHFVLSFHWLNGAMGGVINHSVSCQTDEILQFWHSRKSLLMWVTEPDVTPPLLLLCPTKDCHAKKPHRSLTPWLLSSWKTIWLISIALQFKDAGVTWCLAE